MKKILSIAIVVLMALGLMIPVFASAETAAPAQYLWVNCADGKRLNVRQAPDKNAKVLCQVECGTKLEVLPTSSTTKGWIYVKANGKTVGYVMTKFLQESKPGKYEITERSDNFRSVSAYTVTAKALNAKTEKSVCLRTKPNKTASSLRRLAAGDKLQVIAVGKTWSKVKDLSTGKTGYVANDYIARV